MNGLDDFTYEYYIDDLRMVWQIYEEVHNTSFSPDGKVIVSGDRGLRFFDSTTGALIDFPYEGNASLSHQYFKDGSTLLVGRTWLYCLERSCTEIGIWDTDQKKLNIVFQHEGLLSSFAVSPNGKFVAASLGNILNSEGYKQHQIILWDWATKNELCTFERGNTVAFDPASSALAVIEDNASGEELFQLYDPNTCELIKTLYEAESIGPFTYSPYGHMLALASGPEYKLQILDALTGELFYEQDGQWDTIWQLVFSPDGQYLMTRESYGAKEAIHLWKVIAP
jgi:WD40 repeat protein